MPYCSFHEVRVQKSRVAITGGRGEQLRADPRIHSFHLARLVRNGTRPRCQGKNRGLSQYRTRCARGQKSGFQKNRRAVRKTATSPPNSFRLCGLCVWPRENRVRQMFRLVRSSHLRVPACAGTIGKGGNKRRRRNQSASAKRPARKGRAMRGAGDGREK